MLNLDITSLFNTVIASVINAVAIFLSIRYLGKIVDKVEKIKPIKKKKEKDEQNKERN
jgi:large-conductance mechanosensitive channel